MFNRIFAIACDTGYLPGLFGTLNSIYAYHGNAIPVFVYERQFGPADRARLEEHPLAPCLFHLVPKVSAAFPLLPLVPKLRLGTHLWAKLCFVVGSAAWCVLRAE